MEPEKNSLSWEERLARLQSIRRAEEGEKPFVQIEVPKKWEISVIDSTPGRSQVSLNTHDYDGKLKETIANSQPLLPISEKDFDSELAKMRRVMELFQTLEGGSPLWSTYFDLIVKDRMLVPQNNFDPSNGVDAAQVLYNISLKIKTLLSLTQMQLEDMASGPCPQGRATRLLSVFLST